jgi:hypothetical protein
MGKLDAPREIELLIWGATGHSSDDAVSEMRDKNGAAS